MLQSHYQVEFVESIVTTSLGADTVLNNFQFLYCGNFNLAAVVDTTKGKYFVKWNKGDFKGLFESEAKSMELLRATNTLTVPTVYGYGQLSDGAFLMIDLIKPAEKAPNYWEHLGQQLATLHMHTQENFGFPFDNYFGAILQKNTPMANGVQFYIEQRLQPIVALAHEKGHLTAAQCTAFEQIYKRVEQDIPQDKPALLHGDFWSGNLMVGTNGLAIMVDPSSYYGFREAELSYTGLFGGFDKPFYHAYNEAFPLEPGFKNRIDLYHLYPLLIQLCQVGGGTAQTVANILNKYA
jgi:protein-ribulosamine 3-kinase